MGEFVFEIQGRFIEIKKVTLQQEIDFLKYVDQGILSINTKGSGILNNVALALEKLPGLMEIIFPGSGIKWLEVDSEKLLDIKKAFEKKNSRIISLLKSTFRNSGLNPMAQLTELAEHIGQTFSSFNVETAPQKKPTTSKQTGHKAK